MIEFSELLALRDDERFLDSPGVFDLEDQGIEKPLVHIRVGEKTQGPVLAVTPFFSPDSVIFTLVECRLLCPGCHGNFMLSSSPCWSSGAVVDRTDCLHLINKQVSKLRRESNWAWSWGML